MSRPETMTAAVYHGQGDIRIAEVPTPSPGPEDLLLRVATVGICGTDAHEYATGPHMFPADHPHIPGHEFSGHVVAHGGNVEGFSVDDLVTSGAGISCGECHWCQRGSTNLCARYVSIGLQLPGALAHYVVVPARICATVDQLGLSPDVAALAQPMSIAVHSMRRGRVKQPETAVIIGAGGIGAFLIYAIAQSGADVVAFDLDPDRLKMAESLGASEVRHPPADAGSGWPLAGKAIPSVIYEATGTQPGLRLALQWAEPGTRVVLVGIQGQPVEVEFRDVTLSEVELIGTNAHAYAADFPEALRLLGSREDGWSDVAPTAIPLHAVVEEGLKRMLEGSQTRIKTLVDPWGEEARPTH